MEYLTSPRCIRSFHWLKKQALVDSPR